MKTQVSLLLICMLFSKALSLNCYQCLPSLSATCTNEQTTCSDQCLTSTISTYTSDTKLLDVSMKTCGTADMCVSGSTNLGTVKVSSNTKCCSTDLCNSATLSAPPKQAPNGRICYTCGANGCSEKVSCEGSEDRCVSASVQQGSSTVSLKGCVSKSFCVESTSSSIPGFGVAKVQCCEGNLCNGAESFTLNL
ncbi:lymphocyte antigen 6D-like [Hemibagrus wyckioides]|uniref:lymphocyte antigen 6D-like n=1 Tax=Hemibagrus wyckioides TaxID=337641 RepID=UPI00266C545F|nr:lymphocyte antigen 6D-like [Hemibagrus wyckioides]